MTLLIVPLRRIALSLAAAALTIAVVTNVTCMILVLKMPLRTPLLLQGDLRLVGEISRPEPPAPPPQGRNRLIEMLLEESFAAIDAVDQGTTNPAELAKLAAEEFVKTTSGEAAKGLVEFFRGLIHLRDSGRDKHSPVISEYIATFAVKEIVRYFPYAAPPGPERPAVLLQELLTFDHDSSELDPSDYDALRRVREVAEANPDTVVLIKANTDTVGNVAHNAHLADRRAAAVINELRRNLTTSGPGGLAANRVYVSSLAVTSLPVVTAAGVSEKLNRSVTIVVQR